MFTKAHTHVTTSRFSTVFNNPVIGCLTIVLLCTAPAAHAAISLQPGFFSSTYSTLNEPMQMSFAPDGTMFVGNTTGGDADVLIYNVPAGGGPAQFYGDTIIHDPDAVVFDTVGTLSGVAGTVLVGGGTAPPGGGLITAIRPDETTVSLIGPTQTFRNPNHLVLDSQQRLLISDSLEDGVFVSTDGSTVSSLISLATTVTAIEVDSSDRIYVLTSGGAIRQYEPDGSLITNSFATGLAASSRIAIGTGSARWGDDVYVADPLSDRLIRLDALGNRTVLATGFSGIGYHLEFGTDDALYISMRDEGQIVRIVPEPSTITLAGLACSFIIVRCRRRPLR